MEARDSLPSKIRAAMGQQNLAETIEFQQTLAPVWGHGMYATSGSDSRFAVHQAGEWGLQTQWAKLPKAKPYK